MNVRELRWWSATALAAIGAEVEPTWSRWCESWGVARATVVAMNACEALPPAGACAMETMVDGNAWVGVDLRSRDETVRGLLFGDVSPSPTHDESMAHEIAELAWADLRARLAPVLDDGNRAIAIEGSSPPQSDVAEWSGAVVLRLSCSTMPVAGVVLHLSAPCVARLANHGVRRPAPATAATRPRTCSVSEAIQDQHVSLRVGLDDVLLDFATLGSLRCGDVLSLAHRLDQALRVRVVTSDHDAIDHDLCAGVLGARGQRRAVELVRLP